MNKYVAAGVNLLVIFTFFVITMLTFFWLPIAFCWVMGKVGNYDKRQWYNALLSWDMCVNMMVNGNPANTISARTGYWAQAGCPVALLMEAVIDRVMREEHHCQHALQWTADLGIKVVLEPFPFFHSDCAKGHIEANTSPSQVAPVS